MTGYVVIEGHGEVEAVTNVLTRLVADLGLTPIHWRPPMRKAVTSERVAVEVCDIVRSKADIDCLLVLRDEDDRCPKDAGLEISAWLASAALPFPAAATLLHREYEVLFYRASRFHLGCRKPGASDGVGSGAAWGRGSSMVV